MQGLIIKYELLDNEVIIQGVEKTDNNNLVIACTIEDCNLDKLSLSQLEVYNAALKWIIDDLESQTLSPEETKEFVRKAINDGFRARD